MRYIVWVGGVDDEYSSKENALAAVDEWKSQGYDDVQLEERKEDQSLVYLEPPDGLFDKRDIEDHLIITNSYDGDIMLCSCKCGCDMPAGSIDGCRACQAGACGN